jgi:hypothetical protein
MILTIDKLLINLSDINAITYRCAITESNLTINNSIEL